MCDDNSIQRYTDCFPRMCIDALELDVMMQECENKLKSFEVSNCSKFIFDMKVHFKCLRARSLSK